MCVQPIALSISFEQREPIMCQLMEINLYFECISTPKEQQVYTIRMRCDTSFAPLAL